MNSSSTTKPIATVTRLTRNAICAVSLLAVTACGTFFDNREIPTFDGVLFRTKSGAVDKDDKKDFLVSVSPASASLEGAREAGRWEATRYCIKFFGTSSIDWTVGPDDEQLSVTDDKLSFLGRCDP